MRMQERGIGNLPFIAVLVLLIVAGAMFFVAQDKADTAKEEITRLKKLNTDNGQIIVAARGAYDAWGEVFGFDIAAAKRDGDKYPSAEAIKNGVRSALMKRTVEIAKASEANLAARTYTVSDATNEVKVIKGETTQIILYHTTFTDQIVTVQAMLAPLDAQFRFAAKLMEENNAQFEQASSSYDTNVKANQAAVKTMDDKYKADIGEKQSANDQLKNDLDQVRDQVNNLQAQNDTLQSGSATVKAEAEKKVSTRDRKIRALSDRIKNLKTTMEIALEEDPKDGEVLVASRSGVVYLNLGRQNKLSAGTKFEVWRAAKGNLRENVAVVQVTKVDRTSSQARIIKLINARVPVTAGMNISNPFYDPSGAMKVFIYGDLKHYPTEVARKRLAASGVTVGTRLDETIKVIVLGEPPVAAAEDSGDEEEDGGAAAERRASIERDKRLTEILNTAKSIGAIVVTEDVLRTFINY